MTTPNRSHRKLRTELEAGRITKPAKCEVCKTGKAHIAHHWRGYGYPLDVWWVCITCNRRLDVHDGSISLKQASSYVKKTDNHNPAAKLELRRYFLRKYHADGSAQVLDCCQGGGLLWNRLRDEFATMSYWGLDVKPKKGRLKLDSARILAQPGWPQDVVDVDTYGSPWKHWAAMLPNVARPMTVFLTIGRGGPNRIRLGRAELDAMGLTLPTVRKMSGAITHNLAEIAVSYCLAMSCDYGIILMEAVEAVSGGNARYIGVRLEPKTAAAGVVTRPQPDTTQSEKETENA